MAVEYIPSLTDLTHPQQSDDASLVQSEVLLVKQYVNNVVMPALAAGVIPPSVSGFTYKGNYSAATQYYINNVVSFGGGVYIAVASTLGNAPTNATYWSLVVPANSVLTNEGDLLYYTGGSNSRLPIGVTGTKLVSNGVDPVWKPDDNVPGFTIGNSAASNNALTLPPPTISLSNPAIGPVIRPVSRAYTNGFHVWLNKNGEVCFRGSSSSFYFGGNNAGGASFGTIILNNFSANSGVLAANEQFVQVHAAWNNILALTNLGNVFAIGANSNGICGEGTTVEKRVWVKIPTLGPNATWGGKTSPIVALHIGLGIANTTSNASDPSCAFAIDTNGRLFAWGSGALGQLGNGATTASITAPVLISGPWNTTKVTQVHSSGVHTLVLDANGLMYGTGYNGGGSNTYGGALGNGNNTNLTSFTRLAASIITTPIRQVLASADTGVSTSGYYATSYAVTLSGVYGTGYNADGRLSVSNTTSTNAFAAINQILTGDTTVALYASGEGAFLTILIQEIDSVVFAYGLAGYNGGGQCADGTTVNRTNIYGAPATNSQFSYNTSAVNGVVNNTIIYFGTNTDHTNPDIVFPIGQLNGNGTHGFLVHELGYWWYLGPQGLLNLAPATQASSNYAQIMPMPQSIMNGTDTIVDVINNSQANGAAGCPSSLVIQCASGKQYALGNNNYKQYNDSGLYLAQFASIPL